MSGLGIPSIHLGNPYVKIWIWQSAALPDASCSYGHVALEVLHPGQAPTYMSFRAAGRHAFHFHSSKNQDDLMEEGKIAVAYDLYSLDVLKIKATFQTFMKQPGALGSLGWAIFRKSYDFNATGLTTYLLEQGGIFKLTSYKRDPTFVKVLQIIGAMGGVFGALTRFSSYQFSHLVEHPDEFSAYTIGHGLLVGANHFANIDCVAIHKSALALFMSQKNRHIRSALLKISEKAEDINDLLKSPSGIRVSRNAVIIPSLKGAAQDASRAFSNISKLLFLTSICCLGSLYLYCRFLQGTFTSSDDIKRLVNSAQKKEVRQKIAQLLIRAHSEKEGAYDRKKIALLATCALCLLLFKMKSLS